jgi:hypothetical protein
VAGEATGVTDEDLEVGAPAVEDGGPFGMGHRQLRVARAEPVASELGVRLGAAGVGRHRRFEGATDRAGVAAP